MTLFKGRENSNPKSDDPEDFRATLFEHLEELRTRIVRSAVLLAVAWIGGWFLEPVLYSVLHKMVDHSIRRVLPAGSDYAEVFTTATAPFMLQLRLSFIIGLIISFPFIVLQIWAFVSPGLKKKERRPFQHVAPVSVFLFALGCSFGWLILPNAISWFTQFLVNFQGARLYQEPGAIIFLVLKLLLAFGIGFQLPLVVFILGALDLLSAETLMQYWRQASVAIFVIAAAVTPSNDPFSMLVMAIPLVILFIISAYAVKFVQRRKRKSERLAKEEEERLLAEPLPEETTVDGGE